MAVLAHMWINSTKSDNELYILKSNRSKQADQNNDGVVQNNLVYIDVRNFQSNVKIKSLPPEKYISSFRQNANDGCFAIAIRKDDITQYLFFFILFARITKKRREGILSTETKSPILPMTVTWWIAIKPFSDQSLMDYFYFCLKYRQMHSRTLLPSHISVFMNDNARVHRLLAHWVLKECAWAEVWNKDKLAILLGGDIRKEAARHTVFFSVRLYLFFYCSR